MKKTHKVKRNEAGMRLDVFLSSKSDDTRSQIKKRIERGEILVNKKPAKVHEFLKEGDEIRPAAKKKGVLATAAPAPKKRKSPSLKPKIIFEDENFIVLDKPSGMLVHPTSANETNTLMDWLIAKYPKIKKVGEEKYRCGIIHRTDRDVSGILLAAKTQKAYLHMKNEFKKRRVKKEYLALVYGNAPDEGKIDLPIGRSKDGRFVSHPRVKKTFLTKKDKSAITLYQKEKTYEKFSLLRVRILTGRTHQIRAHLSAIGHPIVGDDDYGPRKTIFKERTRKIKVIDVPRIFLHAEKIGFANPDETWSEFSSPMPSAMKKYLRDANAL